MCGRPKRGFEATHSAIIRYTCPAPDITTSDQTPQPRAAAPMPRPTPQSIDTTSMFASVPNRRSRCTRACIGIESPLMSRIGAMASVSTTSRCSS